MSSSSDGVFRRFSRSLDRLFPHDPPADTRRSRLLFKLWNWGLLIGATLVLGVASLTLAIGNYDWVVFFDILHSGTLLALNLLPPVLLAVLFYGLIGRTWIAYLCTALPVLALSIGDFYKMTFRDDPVVAADLGTLGVAARMTEQYHLFYADKIALSVGIAVLSTLALALLARGRLRGRKRRICTAFAALVLMAAAAPLYLNDRIYSKNADYEHLNRWSATDQYISHGLLYPFLHSIKDAVHFPPKGYNAQETAALLGQYADFDIPEGQKVNVIGIMLEAFSDFSEFPQIEFVQDVYADYHALEQESYHGHLLTNIFAGGTINTERAFLTGTSSGAMDFRSATSSYARYLARQGYHTSGDHPCRAWFYNRRNINEYLGFSEYRFIENRYGELTIRDYAMDDIFFPELTSSLLAQMEDDAPLFSFSVSYQGHGPYYDAGCAWGETDDYIRNNDLPANARNILANYLGSVKSTQGHVMTLVDTLRDCGEPVVLVLFGDHKPWLGNNGAVYDLLGIPMEGDSEEILFNHWSTSYLFWANDAAKAALGTELVGEGPTVSPCYLMNLLFRQLGWGGDAYMQAVAPCMDALPVMCVPDDAYLTRGGVYTRTPDDAAAAYKARFDALEYYRLTHPEE